MLKDSLCLLLIAWPRVINGSLWTWGLHRAGRVQSDVTVDRGSLVFYCPCPPWPWWEPPVQHEGKGKSINLPSWNWLHQECHLPILLQENTSCDKPNSLIVVDDVTCSRNGEGRRGREQGALGGFPDFPALHVLQHSPS